MKKEDIITLPNAHLRERSRKIRAVTDEVRQFAKDMTNALSTGKIRDRTRSVLPLQQYKSTSLSELSLLEATSTKKKIVSSPY